jgi:uncharacterized membrane protein YeaQ/YmgE (transglycosylase-associated protein family)
MGIFSWILFGAIAGWLASIIVKKNDQQGALGNIIVGILGSAVGGWLAGFLFDSPGVTDFNFYSFVVAVSGAVIVLLIKNALAPNK